MGSEHGPRLEKTEGTMDCARLTGAFEMGDLFKSSAIRFKG